MTKGLTTLALTASVMALGACEQGQSDSPPGEEVCTAKSTRAAIQEALFDGAVAKFKGEPLAINDMRRLAKSKLDYVEFKGTNQAMGRTNCAARLKLAVPVSVQEKFGALDELQADITYSTRKAEDGSGRVVEVKGLDFAIDKIVAAFSGKPAPAPKPSPEPAPEPTPEPSPTLTPAPSPPPSPTPGRVTFYNPSFSCNGKLTRIERLICTDPVLARLDREMAAIYFRALEAPRNANRRDTIVQNQRSWLRAISHCETTVCVEATQRDRITFMLNNF